MTKTKLLLAGITLLLLENFVINIDNQVQFILFFIGIVTLGIPHGAADLLVANKNAINSNQSFTKLKFFLHYIGNLLLFGIILYFLPFLGILLFLAFAAYHFGETDLHQFNTTSFIGKLFIFSYGLLILATILLTNFETIKPLLVYANLGEKFSLFFVFIENNNYTILSFIGILFFMATFIYFNTVGKQIHHKEKFLVELGIIIVVLYNLPLILGFTFYFVCWHSLLSIQKIIKYLHKDNFSTPKKTIFQISIFSAIALVGIALFGLSGVMFLNNSTQIIYIIFGLAVLTAPHMQIMYDMYTNMRKKT